MTGELGKKGTPALEQHYTAAQLAEKWGLSDDFIRKLFEKEEGVLVIERPETQRKRGYVSLRIPEWVADRVYQRLVRHKRPTLASMARAAGVITRPAE